MSKPGKAAILNPMTLYKFIGAAIVVLLVSYLAAGFSRRLGLGSILGLLAAGAVLGPSGFKLTESAGGLREFTELGVVFLLFVIGLQHSVSQLWRMRADVLGLGSAQLLVTGGVLALFLRVCGAQAWSSAWLGGLTLALSSTAFVMQILEDQKKVTTDYGRASFGVLLAQDLAVIPLLALVSLLGHSESGPSAAHSVPPLLRLPLVVAVLAGIVLMSRYLLPRLLLMNVRARNPSGFAVVTQLGVLVAAWVAHSVGLSMALGAFVVGLFLSSSPFRLQITSFAERWKEMLLSLFFIAVGMNLDFSVLRREGIIVFVLVLGILLIKSAVLMLLCMVFRKTPAASVRTALLCAQCGEFAFVLAAQSQRLGVIRTEAANVMVLTVSVTMALTPLLAKLADILGRYAEGHRAAAAGAGPALPSEPSSVLVGGFGHCGEAVASFLRERQVAFTALDMDWDRVASGRQRGYPVFGGDITDLEVLKGAGAADCDLFVIASNDGVVAEKAVLAFRLVARPSTPVVVRVEDRAQAEKVRAAGASEVVVEYDEIGRRLTDSVSAALGQLSSPARPAWTRAPSPK